MTYLSDARILAKAFYSHMDPNAPSLERLPSSVQEAWLLVAAAARLMNSIPEPLPQLQPGLLYMAQWSEHDSWYGDAPRRPTVVFTLGSRMWGFNDEVNEVPALINIETPPVKAFRIPGLIYDITPLN